MTEEEIKKIVKSLKKDLGTGETERKVDNKHVIPYEYGFQGDHRDVIKKYIIAHTSIPENKIKVQ
jgi:translation initiation factor 1 (eIF-1/SUI1)